MKRKGKIMTRYADRPSRQHTLRDLPLLFVNRNFIEVRVTFAVSPEFKSRRGELQDLGGCQIGSDPPQIPIEVNLKKTRDVIQNALIGISEAFQSINQAFC